MANDIFLKNLRDKVNSKIKENQDITNELLVNLRNVIDQNTDAIKSTTDFNTNSDVPPFIINNKMDREAARNRSQSNSNVSMADLLNQHKGSQTTPETDDTQKTEISSASGNTEEQAKAPVEKLLTRKKIKELSNKLGEKVFGQEPVINEVVDILKVAALNIRANKKKPAGNYMFAGPSGVGKTELARTLAESLEAPIIVVNMGEYGLEQDVTKLIGTSPGYVGYNEGGILTNFVSKNPRCIVLLDEIEKAHPSIDKILLSILDHGICTDNKGNEVAFDQTIVITTSNLGAEVEYFTHLTKEQKDAERMSAIKENLRPEIINRFDSIFHFASLSKDIYQKVVGKMFESIQKNVQEEHDFELKYSEKMMKFIVDKSFDPAMGGRPARRFIEKIVLKSLVDFMLEDHFEKSIETHKTITLDINKEGNIYFKGKNNKSLGVLNNTKDLVAIFEAGKFTEKTEEEKPRRIKP